MSGNSVVVVDSSTINNRFEGTVLSYNNNTGVLTITGITNIKGTEIILELCSKYNKPVLITSTSEVYGKNNTVPLNEESDRVLGSPLLSRWSYSEAKAIDESMAYFYFQEKGLPIRLVRLFNTVGPRQVGNYGMVLPRFVAAALKN